jgi:hypothetical protein
MANVRPLTNTLFHNERVGIIATIELDDFCSDESIHHILEEASSSEDSCTPVGSVHPRDLVSLPFLS